MTKQKPLQKAFAHGVEALIGLSADPSSVAHAHALSGLINLIGDLPPTWDCSRLMRRANSDALMKALAEIRDKTPDHIAHVPAHPRAPARRPASAEECLGDLSRAMSGLPQGHRAQSDFRMAALALYPFVQNIGQAFSAIIRTRDAELLEALLSQYPEHNWHLLARQHISIGSLAAERRLDLIVILNQSGVGIASDIHHMINAAIDNDDADVLTFLRDTYCYTEPFWKPGRFGGHLCMCGPRLAPFMLTELLTHLENPHGRAMTSFWPAGAQFARWKQISSLLATGKDVTPHFRGRTRLPDMIRALVEKTRSRHGQLSLMALEPDAISVIGRDSDASFYGMPAAEVEEMLRKA